MREEVPAVIQTKRRKCAIGDLKKIATPEKVEVFRYLLAARTLHQSKKSDLEGNFPFFGENDDESEIRTHTHEMTISQALQ